MSRAKLSVVKPFPLVTQVAAAQYKWNYFYPKSTEIRWASESQSKDECCLSTVIRVIRSAGESVEAELK